MAKTREPSAPRGTGPGRKVGPPRSAEHAGAGEAAGGSWRESRGGEATSRKNFNLFQSKIDLAREILGTATETETIDQALDLVIFGEQLARGTRRARGRAFHDLFGEGEAGTPPSVGE